MIVKPSGKLNSYNRLYSRVQNTLYGDGYNEGVLLPTGLKIVVSSFLILGVMYVNGFYENRKEFLKILTLIALLSMILQLFSALIGRFLDKDFVLNKAHEIIKKFYENEELNEDYCRIMNSVIDKSILTLKFYVFISFMFYQLAIVPNWIIALWTQEYFLAFNVYFPFTNPKTLFGFLINMLVLSFAPTLFWLCIEMRTTHAIFYPMQFISMVKIFAKKLEKFAEELREFQKEKIEFKPEPSSSRVSDTILIKVAEKNRLKKFEKLERQLINFIKEYEEFVEYKSCCLIYMEYMAFIALSSNSVTIGLALVYIRLVSIPIGLSLLFMSFFQVLVPCVIGTIVSTQNEKLIDAVCCFSWYELSPKMRKVYLQFLHQCQNTNGLELPIIGELNMELFTDIMNASYSYLTYLLNFT